MAERKTGRIVRSLSGFYEVQTPEGLFTCRGRGSLRKGQESPLTGDIVQITVEHNEESQRQDNQQREDFYDGRNGQHGEQQQRRDDRRGGADFLQQLRLGLIPLEDEEET